MIRDSYCSFTFRGRVYQVCMTEESCQAIWDRVIDQLGIRSADEFAERKAECMKAWLRLFEELNYPLRRRVAGGWRPASRYLELVVKAERCPVVETGESFRV